MSAILLQNGKQAFTDANGHPLAGGRVYFYSPNTSTPKDTWQDSAQTILNTNPIILDARGEASIYGTGSYRQVLTDASLVQIWDQFIPDLTASVTDAVNLFFTKAETIVDNIATLRLLDSTIYKNVQTKGYYTIGDNGNGSYYFDPTDTTSPDNGGSVIVGLAGARWKLKPTIPVNVRQFGAKADDATGTGTNSFAAIQAAINFAVTNKIGEVEIVGKFMIADTLVMDTGIFTQSIVLRGDGATTQIRQTGAGKDAIVFSRTQVLRNSGLKDLSIYCEATAGHGVNIEYSCTVCFFTNVNITVINPVKSLYIGSWGSFGVGARGCFDTIWEGGDYYLSVAHTAFGFDFITNGTAFNENVFRNLRCSQSGLVQMFRIISNDNSSYLTNNRFENINFELCKGGGILCYNARGWVMENITFWDTPLYTNHLIYFATNTGLEAISNTLINIQRNGDVLQAGVKDINIQSGQDTVVINCWTPSTSNPAYDWNNKRVTIMGLTLSGETNIAQRVYANYDNMMTARASILTGTPTILQSTNLASITKNGAGSYRFTFLIPRASANSYNAQATLSQVGSPLLITTTKNAGFVDVIVTTTAGVATDGGTIDLLITG